MLYKIFLFITVVVLSLTTHGQVLAKGLSWAYSVTTTDSQKQEPKSTITFSVNYDITTIEDEKEIITIDYANNILYRYNKRSERCSDFPLSTISPPHYSKENAVLRISSFKLFSAGKSQQLENYTCHLKHILFGADFAKFQTVVPPTLCEFGQKFTELMVSYCVSTSIVSFENLLTIAKTHNAHFQRNQLLRQIDLVGLFEILHGFPVKIIKNVNKTKITMILIEEPHSKSNVAIHQLCQ